MKRREFLRTSAAALAGLSLGACNRPSPDTPDRPDEENKAASGEAGTSSFHDISGTGASSYFSLTQLSSATDTIGNSYLLVTGSGKVIMMDGGMPTDESKLRSRLAAVGNHVDAWFISHPHGDHVGALIPILENRNGISIGSIYYSRLSSTLLSQESGANNTYATPFYNALAVQTETDVINVQRTGQVFTVDGVSIKVLGIANPEILNNAYNNSSMILKVSDATKSVLFLGDAGEECGEKLLKAYPGELECDYIQMAHHGQQGCNQKFYNAAKFKACLWPTPSWLWKAGESSQYKTWETRKWIEAKGITENHVSSIETDWKLK